LFTSVKAAELDAAEAAAPVPKSATRPVRRGLEHKVCLSRAMLDGMPATQQNNPAVIQQ
jgi:hypothetical protein